MMQNSTAADIELLSFRLGEQEYSVEIVSVREIRGWTRATPLPHAPPYLRGVINLRGTVLPVVDLSMRLGMGPVKSDPRNVIIVVQLQGRLTGLVVDAVSDILALPRTDLQPPPDMGDDGSTAFVAALTIFDGRMIRVLDLATVLPRQPVEAA